MSVALLLVLLFAGVFFIGGMAASLSSKNSLKQRVENRRMEENAVRSAKALVLVAGIFGFFLLLEFGSRNWLHQILGSGQTYPVEEQRLAFS